MNKIFNFLTKHLAIFQILSLFDHDNSNIVSKKGWLILSDKDKLNEILEKNKLNQLSQIKYIKGDILICSTAGSWPGATNELYNQKNQHLIVGHKYVIKDVIEIQDRVILDVEHLSSSKRIGLFSDRHFIPLDVYREFQLKKVLDL